MDQQESQPRLEQRPTSPTEASKSFVKRNRAKIVSGLGGGGIGLGASLMVQGGEHNKASLSIAGGFIFGASMGVLALRNRLSRRRS